MISLLVASALAARPRISAWVVGFHPASLQRFKQRAKHLDEVFTEFYTINPQGMPVRREAYRAFFEEVRAAAKASGVKFFGMINNYSTDPGGPEGFEPKRVSALLATAESRTRFTRALVKMLKQDGVEGIDFDLESLTKDDRERYSALAHELQKTLRPQRLLLSITVHPKLSEPGGWDGQIAHDYAALGKSADRLNVMTYDYSWSGSEPGPIAPTEWVERVIKFTKTQVPSSKIGLGIAAYGYDWTSRPGASLAWADFNPQGATLDPASGEWVSGARRFSGTDAFKQKWKLAQTLGVGSVAFWYCGSEEPGVWGLITARK